MWREGEEEAQSFITSCAEHLFNMAYKSPVELPLVNTSAHHIHFHTSAGSLCPADTRCLWPPARPGSDLLLFEQQVPAAGVHARS